MEWCHKNLQLIVLYTKSNKFRECDSDKTLLRWISLSSGSLTTTLRLVIVIELVIVHPCCIEHLKLIVFFRVRVLAFIVTLVHDH